MLYYHCTAKREEKKEKEIEGRIFSPQQTTSKKRQCQFELNGEG